MDDVVVTGAGGFLGTHVMADLSSSYRVIGCGLKDPTAVRYKSGEYIQLSTHTTIDKVIGQVKPDVVVHCAFINKKPTAWSSDEYLAEEVRMDSRLFEACAEQHVKVIVVGSSAVYGSGRDRLGLMSEDSPLIPVSLYGLAKLSQELLAAYYSRKGMRACIARLFNLVGPGQGRGMVVSDWIAGVREIRPGVEPMLRVRTLATARDFVDVRDAARAVRLLIVRFRESEVVNVASGVAVGLDDLMEELKRISGVTFSVLEESGTVPPDDVQVQRGSFSKLSSGWGWQPEVSWRQSLRDAWNEA